MDISLLVCTYNRCQDLKELLATAVIQKNGGQFEYEIVVVDNNSHDATRQVVEEFIEAGHSNIRYFFEPRQGRSLALNTGLEVLHGRYYAIADDDLLLPPDYLATIVATFDARPDLSFLGGKVLPRWSGPVPQWLTPEHWSALALCDYGDAPLEVDRDHPLTLLAAAFRTRDVLAVNGYREELGVSPRRIGGTEDTDLFSRLFSEGKRGLYAPGLWLLHKVEPERMLKRYHRRWHLGHGRTFAVMRNPVVEAGRFRLFDVPSHMYRDAATKAVGWCGSMVSGRWDLAFRYECELRFFAGFVTERRADS